MATSDMALAFKTTDGAPENRVQGALAVPARQQMYSACRLDSDFDASRYGVTPLLPSEKAEPYATVLVVDDEISIALLLEELLDSVGYRVLLAHSGRSGLELARSAHPAIVLTDCMMPGLDGAEFVRRLRGSPVTNMIPVVMMSSIRPRRVPTDGIVLRAAEDRIVRTARSGVYLACVGGVHLPFIEKPFDLDVVLNVVRIATASAPEE